LEAVTGDVHQGNPSEGGGLSGRDKLTEQQVWSQPELEHFGEQIGLYRKSQNDIGLMQDSHSFGWLLVDYRPLKQSLNLKLGNWVYLFTHYVKNNMLNELKGVNQVLRNGRARLDVKVKNGDLGDVFAMLEDTSLVAIVSYRG
jgi:hypothetical protein